MCRALVPRASERLKGWKGQQTCLPDFNTGRRPSATKVLIPLLPQHPSVTFSLSGCPLFALGLQPTSKGPPCVPSPSLDEVIARCPWLPLLFFHSLAAQSLMSLSHRYAGGSRWDFPPRDKCIVFTVCSFSGGLPASSEGSHEVFPPRLTVCGICCFPSAGISVPVT